LPYKNRQDALVYAKEYNRKNKKKQSEQMKVWYKKYWKREYQKRKSYHQANRKRENEQNRKYRTGLKNRLFQLLGGWFCVKCGFNDKRALQIAHKNNDGNEDRKRLPTVSTLAIYYLKHPEEAIKKLEILCANCNFIQEMEVLKK